MKEDWSIKMETSMKANGKTIKPTALEFGSIWTEQDMKGIGKTITSMEKALKLGQTEHDTKESMQAEKSKEEADLNGLMGVIMKETLKIVIFMELGFICGVTEENM
eukprot:CAMPEP_0202942552 /NCGR_PEP_ID=MMETSP1395-20130829/2769_1 /ASSEMBLY_ACC=CAM_ASM_000871 /TAXON_ID=5961 /ORGANISM="Blepharisma japonicum, Strain Stock R1072" /LENGTH=105 /DNA_ID=CAMNT_0049638951 /DNA_START=442 /DNA_END=759 /DNA_ORIENTATION=-